jgi:PAS domain S-box-containing protein
MPTNKDGVKLTALRSTHDATLEELQRYKLLVESVEDYAIFLLDADGYIQTWNKGARKNKGYTDEEIIGQHFSVFYLPEDNAAKKPERELKLARRLGRVEDEDWRVRKDGSRFWANVVITALHDEDDTIVGFAKVTRDLTERKHNEDLLRSSNVLLKKQQMELEALNVSKDEFISLASHQLRTPATAVKQLLGMLTQGFVGDLQPEHFGLVERAYEANERQIRIVDNLLKVAQLDAGKVKLNKKPVLLREYLTDILEEHLGTATKKNQKITLEVTDSAPLSPALDADYVRMALGNLIDNASKYSHNDSTINIRATGSGKKLAISVTDTGVGINPKEMDLLFEKFSRLSNELSDSVGGSGLGLYWVKRVVELHGGNISVESTPDKGSVFTIELNEEDSNA